MNVILESFIKHMNIINPQNHLAKGVYQAMICYNIILKLYLDPFMLDFQMYGTVILYVRFLDFMCIHLHVC